MVWWHHGGQPDAGEGSSASAALRAAQRAREVSARQLAERQVLELGELLGQYAQGERPEAAECLGRALDAYAAAAKVLDGAGDIADLGGVLVLARQGRDEFAAAEASGHAGGEHERVPLCFFNPLHGVSARHVSWRPLGQRHVLRVRGCADCAVRVKRRLQPDALTCHVHGRDVPYYELDPAQSIWAATGYGQFSDDLVDRILTGQWRPGRPAAGEHHA